MGNVKKLGPVGFKTFTFYISTTCIAITIAIFIAFLINPGIGLDLSHLVSETPIISSSKSFTEILIGIIPSNPFKSMVEGKMLQIIFFSILLGLSICLASEKTSPVKNL